MYKKRNNINREENVQLRNNLAKQEAHTEQTVDSINKTIEKLGANYSCFEL